MRLRVRSRTGVQTVTVDDSLTITNLCHQLSASKISTGFPPKVISAVPDTIISKLLRDGDVIVIQPTTESAPTTEQPPTNKHTPGSKPVNQQPIAAASAASASTATATISAPASAPAPDTGFQESSSIASQGKVLIREVPDDNSCLFRCICNLTGQVNKPISYFRKLISDEVLNNPHEYPSVVLGKEPLDYVAWIQSDHAWGGAIELAIFAKFFKIQFAAFDVRTKRLDRYAQDEQFDTIAFLIYDGIHYNYCALNINDDIDITQFDPKDSVVVRKIEVLVKELHDNKKFTSTETFNLRCGQCGLSLTGEKHALQHAKATGHTQFDES